MSAAPVGCLDGEQAIRDALAAGPTPGPWSLWGSADPSQVISSVTGFVAQTVSGNDAANARLIAACHPETMRSLLAELDRLRSASRQEAYRQGYEQGWHDRACNSPHAYLAAAPHQAQEAQGDRHGE